MNFVNKPAPPNIYLYSNPEEYPCFPLLICMFSLVNSAKLLFRIFVQHGQNCFHHGVAVIEIIFGRNGYNCLNKSGKRDARLLNFIVKQIRTKIVSRFFKKPQYIVVSFLP
jgi:hypothetical protein